jgi:hypothetical protein
LIRSASAGSFAAPSTFVIAAQWRTSSGRASPTAPSIDAASVMSTSGRSTPTDEGNREVSSRPNCPLCPVMRVRMP